MSRDYLEKRLQVIVDESNTLRSQLDSLSSQTKTVAAQLNMCAGAENEIRYMLNNEEKTNGDQS